MVVTRAEDRAETLKDALEALGAEVIVIPVIRHVPARDARPMEDAIRSARRFTHVVFTSRTAVEAFLEASARLGVPASAWASHRIAAVGEATAGALEQLGLRGAFTAAGGGAALAARMVEAGFVKAEDSALLPQSAIARPELREALERAGVFVHAVAVYDTVPEDPERFRPLRERLEAGDAPDAVVFASPSAVMAFLALGGPRARQALASGRMRAVSIGPTTSEALRREGIAVAAEARAPAADDVAMGAAAAFTSNPS